MAAVYTLANGCILIVGEGVKVVVITPDDKFFPANQLAEVIARASKELDKDAPQLMLAAKTQRIGNLTGPTVTIRDSGRKGPLCPWERIFTGSNGKMGEEGCVLARGHNIAKGNVHATPHRGAAGSIFTE